MCSLGPQLTGKLKLPRGPLNEDVFSAPPHVEEKGPHPNIQELTEQIHRLLLQVGACAPSSPVQAAWHHSESWGCHRPSQAHPTLPCTLLPVPFSVPPA